MRNWVDSGSVRSYWRAFVNAALNLRVKLKQHAEIYLIRLDIHRDVCEHSGKMVVACRKMLAANHFFTIPRISSLLWQITYGFAMTSRKEWPWRWLCSSLECKEVPEDAHLQLHHWLTPWLGTRMLKCSIRKWLPIVSVLIRIHLALLTITPWLMEPGGSMSHSQGLSNNS